MHIFKKPLFNFIQILYINLYRDLVYTFIQNSKNVGAS